MQIVIEIPRKTYEHIRADGGHGYFNIYDEDNRIVTKAVFNGTPLPKGHGDLIDRDSLELDCDWSDYYDGFSAYSESQVRLAPTIIEGSDSE